MDRKVEKLCHSIPEKHLSPEVTRIRRDLPPAHYTFQIESFSKIIRIFPREKEAKYDSDVFECGGYKWRLSFYPNGRREWGGKGSISLYLGIEDTDSFPLGWEVNAIFRLFVLDQIRGEYLTLQDANEKIRRFHAMKTEWGFAQFLSLDTFGDTLNGYLVDDSCVFGAEVFVMKCTGKGERLFILSVPITGICRWEIGKFSTLNVESLSKEFRVRNLKWELKLYPKAVSTDEGESYIRLFLSLPDWKAHPPKGKLYAKYTLRIRGPRVDGQHVEVTDYNWFSKSAWGYDYPKFMLPSAVKDASRSLLNDSLIVETHIEIISVAIFT